LPKFSSDLRECNRHSGLDPEARVRIPAFSGETGERTLQGALYGFPTRMVRRTIFSATALWNSFISELHRKNKMLQRVNPSLLRFRERQGYKRPRQSLFCLESGSLRVRIRLCVSYRNLQVTVSIARFLGLTRPNLSALITCYCSGGTRCTP
jgi:hypothetical protein